MQVSVAGLRRNIKNIAHNYTEPQKKVREATSNDPWGPSSTLMSEIADLTYNIEAFSQIMEMLWKRLNDHGKNWRHVYKSLVLLEYLIKTGSERVAQQCKENIFAIQTLKDFQYFEDNKDQGLNVREKAKQLVTLLGSEERLKNERTRALKARERFAQTMSGFGSSDSNDTTPTSPVFAHNFAGDINGASASYPPRTRNNSELETARPQTVGEEELQLQLALAMSKEEADQEEKRRRSDDIRLQLALSQSEQEFKHVGSPIGPVPSAHKKEASSALVDLLDVDLVGAAALPLSGPPQSSGRPADPWAPAQHGMNLMPKADPWSGSSSTVTSPQDPWGSNPNPIPPADPWQTSKSPPTLALAGNDPWGPNGDSGTRSTPTFVGLDEDEFDTLSKRGPGETFKMDQLGHSLLTPQRGSNNSSPIHGKKKDPLEFLGENKGLVNLDNLLQTSNNGFQSAPTAAAVQNPFAGIPVGPSSSLLTTGVANTVNPFHVANAVQKPSMNEIREKQQQLQIQGIGQMGGGIPPLAPTAARPAPNNPWSPVKENPFLD